MGPFTTLDWADDKNALTKVHDANEAGEVMTSATCVVFRPFVVTDINTLEIGTAQTIIAGFKYGSVVDDAVADAGNSMEATEFTVPGVDATDSATTLAALVTGAAASLLF